MQNINAECLRDFCGEFYNVEGRNKKCALIHKIPHIIDQMIDLSTKTNVSLGWENRYDAYVKAYDFLLNHCESTKEVVGAWDRGEKRVKEFTDEEIDVIYYGFFRNFMSI